jgi:hypothetical protein
MPWYPSSFTRSTRGWPLLARRVYRELLDWQWDVGGINADTLPRDPETLRKEVGATPEEWSVAWPYIEPQLQFADGGTGRRSLPLEEHTAPKRADLSAAPKSRSRRRGHSPEKPA